MGFNVKSLYGGNAGITNNTTSSKSSFNVKSLRDQEFELNVGENKTLGTISYGAKKAIESNTLDSYTPKDKNEKEILYNYRLATAGEVKKDDGTSLGFITQEGLKAIAENNTKNYKPINEAEDKAIKAYVEYATQKRQEQIDNYKATANQKLEDIKQQKSNLADESYNLRVSKNIANRSGKKGTQWETKDTRTAKEKREGTPIAQSEGTKKLKALENESAKLNEQADALVDTISNIDKYANVVYNDKGWIGQSKANYTQGRLSQDTAQAYNDYIVSQTEENRMRADALSALSEQFNINNKDAFTSDDENIGKVSETARDWIAVSFATYLPQFIDQTKASIKGAAIGGATGAAVGSVVPVVGTATGLTYGLKTGWVAGASQQMYETTRGMVFKTLIDAGYDEETAIKAAQDEAFVSSIIEGTGEIISMATLGTGKLVNKIVPNAAKKISSNVVTKGVKGFVAKTGKKISENAFLKTTTSVAGVLLNAMGEYAEEYTQEAVSIANERRLKNQNPNSLIGETLSVLRDQDDETSARLHAAGTEGFRIGLMMGGATKVGTSLGTSASEHISNAVAGNKIKKTDANESGVVQSVIDIGLQQPENTQAYKIATKLSSNDKISSPKLGKLSKENKGETVNVGETYYDTKSKGFFNIVSRDDTTTTVAMVNSDGVSIAKEFSNESVDNMTKNSRYVMVAQPVATTEESSTTETTEIEAVSTEDMPIAENETATGQLVETENNATLTFTNEATEKVYNLLVGEKLTNKGIGEIINTPELREAFTNLTGIAIAGTRSEQRAIVRNFQSNPQNIAKLKQSVGVSGSQNSIVSKETTANTKVTPSQAQNVTEEEIEVVVNAINETLKDGALEEIYESIPSGYEKSLDVWARKLISVYNKLGNIGHIAEYFVDGGKKVIASIESTKATHNLSNATLVQAAQNTENVLKNQPQSDTIKEKTTNTVPDANKSHTVAYTNDNQKIDLAYKVVSVDDLIASNDLDGKVNPNYPQELQPRDRGRVSSQSQIHQIANNLNPARLSESTNVSEGAPIVGPDNVVESGNGRTLAIQLAYKIGTAEEYRNFIINNAEVYGIDVSNLPENPVLVRERLTEVDRVEFTRKANESSIGSLSATEQAKVDAEKLSIDVLNLLVANEEGVINTPDNRDFIASVVGRVFKNEDLNNVVNADGTMLSQRGLERITNAIFYKAYGDVSLSARLSESLDNDMKNATKVLLNIAPRVVAIKNDIKQGESYDFDFSEDIASAVRLFEKCRNDNLKVADYANQTSLFEKEKPLVLEMAYVFETKNRGAKQATEFYNMLLDTVEGMGSPNQISLGITDIFQSKEAIFDAAVNKFNTEVIAENTARGVEPAKNTIAIPESIYRSESESQRDDDRRGTDEVLGDNTSRSEKSGNAVGVQQDNGPSEERGVVTDDEQLRQKNESIERQPEIGEENSDEQIRKDLLHGNGKRRNDGGSRKQTQRILSFRRENKGKDATERQRFARELIERGQTEQVIEKSDGDTVICNLVRPEAYNDDMLSMAEQAKAKGIELGFAVGEMTVDIELDDGTIKRQPIRGVQITPTRILVKYDHSTFSPQQIYKHEYCHAKWKTPEMRKIKNTILNSLSEEDRQTILSMQRYKDYIEGYNNDMNLVWEEFVCDVMSDYSNYTEKYVDVVTDFWYGNEEVEGYDASSYTTSTDAGGKYSFDSEEYTKKEYRNFGWARANNILNAGQNADYRSKFADAKVGRAKFKKTKQGEYIIPVSDIYDKSSRGINNVLVFAKGTIANPVITSVIEIYEYDETSLDRVRRHIYDGERRGIQQETGELFRRYFASDFEFQPNQQRIGTESIGNSSDNRHRGRSSEETSSVKENTKVRYSFDEKDSDYLKAVENGDMETAQRMVDEVAKAKGYNIHAYHGTRRGDRVGNVFLPERATSGPMAFFTDNKEIAENYAKSKQDTSMAYDPDYDSYETQFRVKMKNMDIPLYRAWGYLPFDARNRITQKAQQLREDWDGDGGFILDPNNKEANGGFQWQLKEARGNTLLALNEQWLNSGNLFNEESRFLEVLEMAGVMEEFKKIGDIYFKDPDARHEKVYDTYLRITTPFDTSFADDSFVDGLLAWYEEQDESQYNKESMESDLWDKNSIDAYEFADRVRSDIERGTFHAWTSIPDSVTDYLKSLGYDGIKDLGGKNSDVGHTVWIPFSSEQIKSSEPVTFDDNGNVIPLSQRFKTDNNDIRFSFDDSYAPTFYSHMGKTIDEMKQDKIGANSVVSYLKGRGVKDEEIKWTGIEEFLEGKKSVTKAELQEFVANSQLEIEETVMDGSQSTTLEIQEVGSKDLYVMRGGKVYDTLTWLPNESVWMSDAYGFYFDSMPRIRNYYGVNETGTRWGDYTLKGGENYREIIFKMPNSTYSNDMMQTHWGDNAKGILAHARIQDFDVDGEKMLFIEEIQSDWHNQGQKIGYIGDTKNKELSDARKRYRELEKESNELLERLRSQNFSSLSVEEKKPLADEYISRSTEIAEEQDALKKKFGIYVMPSIEDVPDAPFRNNYHEYVLKSLIRMAAEEGYDSIGWTPADIQSQRWSDDFAEGYRIEYDQEIPKFLNKYGKKWGAKADKTKLSIDELWSEKYAVWSMPITDAMKNSVLYEGQARYSLDTDGILDLEDLWDDAIDKYGTIPKGEIPAREVDVPKKINEKDVVSRGARTMMEAGITPDEAVSEFEKAILDGTMTHEVITNKRASTWARQQIEHLGFEEALNRWTVLSDSGKVGKKELALGMELYNQCITNKDVRNAMKLAAELVAEATNAGQTLQAVRMLKRMTPDGQLYYLEKSVQKINEEFKNKLGEKFKDIELDEDLMEEFLTAKDEAKRDEAYDKICQHIADQIPATLRDKWNSWRYLAMLGNPRTHIRNIVGNAVFTPSIRLKNFVGTVIERATKVDAAERTKSLHKSKEAIEFAKKDFDAMTKVLQGENAKYANTNDIESKRTIFKTKWLEKLRLKNFEFLEKEDLWFLKMHYVDALARLITIRKIDLNSITQNQLETLRAYAVKEAQTATYRDANALADGLNAIQKKLEHSDKKIVRASSALIEGVMPFKKTPLNIAKQGIYYSPVGILKGVYTATAKVKKGDATVTDVIDDIAKGLSGTMLMMFGYFLASLGLLDGDDDKTNKEKAFDQMTGEQSYALKIGDKSYTIDWAAPSNLALFVGSKLYDLTKDDFSFADVTSALSTVTEPLLELSVFSGVNSVIESAQYSESEALLAMGSDMITSYLMQALPTIGGQISRIVDASKKEYYYVDKTSNVPKGLQRLIGQVSSKIPFASYLFETSVDEWGREETYGNVAERAFENTISPGYYSAENYTAVDRELRKLFERTGDSAVLPVIQQKSYTEDYVKYDMTAKEYTQVKKLRGKKSFELVRNLISSSDYRAMTDKEKVKAIKECYTDAGEYAKEQMIEKVKRNSK